MSVYGISDLHLSIALDKSMHIFKGWDNYVQRIESNWKRIVKNEDTVILPGDFSWGLKLEETVKDFEFLNSLPGKKILLKGNHDLWWNTAAKVNKFLEENKFETISILFNSAVKVENKVICGTRGWMYDESADSKIRKREVGRLRLSLNAAAELEGEITLFLHYPPVYGDFVCEDILEVLREFNISTVYHGHIHGSGYNKAVSHFEEFQLKLISADCIDFTPVLIP
ncbi:MAG: metallophosphoesterase [Clostridia bacterium]|nr:metallophosphoesterase [Clostridia bacterium]